MRGVVERVEEQPVEPLIEDGGDDPVEQEPGPARAAQVDEEAPRPVGVLREDDVRPTRVVEVLALPLDLPQADVSEDRLLLGRERLQGRVVGRVEDDQAVGLEVLHRGLARVVHDEGLVVTRGQRRVGRAERERRQQRRRVQIGGLPNVHLSPSWSRDRARGFSRAAPSLRESAGLDESFTSAGPGAGPRRLSRGGRRAPSSWSSRGSCRGASPDRAPRRRAGRGTRRRRP